MSHCKYVKPNCFNNDNNNKITLNDYIYILLEGNINKISINTKLEEYSYDKLLNMFNLSKDSINVNNLNILKRKILLLHPDKNKLIPKEHYIFFMDSYKLILSYYEYFLKQNILLPDNEIKYNINEEINIDKNTKKIIKEKIDYNESNKDKYLLSIDKNIFNNEFNKVFTNRLNVENTNSDELKKWWYNDKDDNLQIEKINNNKDMNNIFDKMRNDKNGLIVYNNDYKPLNYTGSCNTISKSINNENGYINCDPFNNLKYDDITRVYRDEKIIQVNNSEFERANKIRNIEDYKLSFLL